MVKVLKKNVRSFGILLVALMLAVSFLGFAIPASAQNSTETDFINILNAERITLNENTLAINSNLSTAAYLHSKDMAENGYFSHTSADGRTFDQRIIAAGYTNWTGLAENIAYYYGSPDAIIIYNMWKNSAGHYANMIGNFTDAGLGVYTLNNYTYCTLDLGRSSSPPAANFSLLAFPSALNIAAGTSTNSTITITSVNSFTGTVVLSNGPLPAGWTAAFTPISLAIVSGGSKSSILSITTPSSAQTGTYTFTIAGTSGSTSHSTTVMVNIQGIQNVPSVPQNLQAKAGDFQVALRWSAPSNSGSSAIMNYRVYRRTASTSATLFATLGNVLSYNDSGAANGQTYYYVVTAVNAVGESKKSNEVYATPAASAQSTTVTSPNGGENWAVGSSQNITWSSVGITGNVNILISRNGGSTWTTIVSFTANDGTQAWMVSGPPTNQARIKVVSVATPTVFDISDANFLITPQTINVTSPNGGENWVTGSSHAITWSSAGITGNVNILISRNGGSTWTAIISNTPNDGTHSWTVTGPTMAQARIKVVSVATPTVFDISDANFTIAQSITVTSPNGGESWALGSGHNITWSSIGITGNVNILISRNGGGLWTSLIANTLNDGTQAWPGTTGVTGPATPQARIKVVSVATPTVFDISDASFTITGP